MAKLIKDFSLQNLYIGCLCLTEAAAEDISQHVLQAGTAHVARLPGSGDVDPLRCELVLVLEVVSADVSEPRMFLVNLDGDGCFRTGGRRASGCRHQVLPARGGDVGILAALR